MEQMKIQVTQDDIDKGDHTYWNCPVARACFRKEGCTEVLIHPTNYYILYKGSIFMYDNPPEVTRFIYEFDSDIDVHPFEFELPILE